MHTDHWNKRALDFVRPHFDQARRLARIATGFFTVQGFDLVRQVLAGKQVQLLVGFDEKSKERLRQELIEGIIAHLASGMRTSVVLRFNSAGEWCSRFRSGASR